MEIRNEILFLVLEAAVSKAGHAKRNAGPFILARRQID
jgi:hypothetical protein